MQRLPCIVDTNVPLVANGANVAAGDACQRASVDAIDDVMKSRKVVLDDGWRILAEYQHKLNPKGGQLVGDLFLLWLLQNLWTPTMCERVHITPKAADASDFEEFPDVPGLQSFDRSDRKFVAVALAHPAKPEVLVSYDTDWLDHQVALQNEGVQVRFICEEAIKEAAKRKKAKKA